MDRKKEYHSRVSPIVLIGGLPSIIHIAEMNTRKMTVPLMLTMAGTAGRFEIKARTAAESQQNAAAAANQIKTSHIICLSSSSLRSGIRPGRTIISATWRMPPASTTDP